MNSRRLTAVAGAAIHPAAKVALVEASLGAAALCLWMLYGTYYELTEESLIAQCGPFGSTIPLSRIQAVKATRNPLASRALSLDRLHIA